MKMAIIVPVDDKIWAYFSGTMVCRKGKPQNGFPNFGYPLVTVGDASAGYTRVMPIGLYPHAAVEEARVKCYKNIPELPTGVAPLDVDHAQSFPKLYWPLMGVVPTTLILDVLRRVGEELDISEIARDAWVIAKSCHNFFLGCPGRSVSASVNLANGIKIAA